MAIVWRPGSTTLALYSLAIAAIAFFLPRSFENTTILPSSSPRSRGFMFSTVPITAATPDNRPPRLRCMRSSTVKYSHKPSLSALSFVSIRSRSIPCALYSAALITSRPIPRPAPMESNTSILRSGYISRRSSAAMREALYVPLIPEDMLIYSTSLPFSRAFLKFFSKSWVLVMLVRTSALLRSRS